MINEKIRWASIQPLTGGMYLGAEEAIGHPAEFILSYKGLSNIKTDTDGNIVDAGNEYNLLEYLKKHNRCPKYYQLNKGMFDADLDNMNPEIYCEDILETPNYDNLDLVVAVPVCSGLSMVTSGTTETKNSRNCNMLWISKYTLSVIQPKIYIFENAPTFMGSRGTELRAQFEEMAQELGYSILYYKTDTKFHHNCQQRPRTFVIFFKHNEDIVNQYPFIFEYEDKNISVKDFFASIDNDNLTQNEPVLSACHNYIVIDFVKMKYGNIWKDVITGSLMDHIILNGLLDELISFIETSCDHHAENVKEKTLKYIKHIKYKKSLGLNYYGDDVCLCKTHFPSVQFRSIPNMLHPSGERICSCREYLSLMGMPEDFTLYGNRANLAKIGQNVPVKTAKFIVEQAIKHLNSWNEKRLTHTNVIYQDNIKKTIMDY
jgi:site-specific DNA-cytosine methylase